MAQYIKENSAKKAFSSMLWTMQCIIHGAICTWLMPISTQSINVETNKSKKQTYPTNKKKIYLSVHCFYYTSPSFWFDSINRKIWQLCNHYVCYICPVICVFQWCQDCDPAPSHILPVSGFWLLHHTVFCLVHFLISLPNFHILIKRMKSELLRASILF